MQKTNSRMQESEHPAEETSSAEEKKHQKSTVAHHRTDGTTAKGKNQPVKKERTYKSHGSGRFGLDHLL